MHILHKYIVTRVFSKCPVLMKKINPKCILYLFTTVEDIRGFSKILLNFHPLQQINKQARRTTTVYFFFNNVAHWTLGFPAYWISFWHRYVSCLQQSWRKISSLITIPLQLSFSWTSKLFRLLDWIVCVVIQSSKALARVCLTDYHLESNEGRRLSVSIICPRFFTFITFCCMLIVTMVLP